MAQIQIFEGAVNVRLDLFTRRIGLTRLCLSFSRFLRWDLS